MWNDTEIPLAYLITFRAYGTWLHGDKRGSVDRFNNKYVTPFIAPNQDLHRYKFKLKKYESVKFNAEQRSSIDAAIRETCDLRNWRLHAINVRTNHIHLVVSIGDCKPENALIAFKANATRKMRESNCWLYKYSPWAEKGSRRHLWNERNIESAVEYVINGQGEDLPKFD